MIERLIAAGERELRTVDTFADLNDAHDDDQAQG